MNNFVKRITNLDEAKRSIILGRIPPASFSQIRLYHLEKTVSELNNVSSIPLLIEGNINLDSLEKSLNQIIKNQEILRTIIPEIDNRIVQIVLPFESRKLEIRSIAHLNEIQQKSEIRTVVNEYLTSKMSLSDGPLWMSDLFQLARDKYVFLLTFHQTIFDGLSLNVVIGELVGNYFSHERKSNAAVASLSVQYSNYARWQHATFSDENLTEEEIFWKDVFKKIPTNPQLPLSNERTNKHLSKAQDFESEVEKSVSAEVKSFCLKEQMTVPMLGIAAFALTLASFSGCSDFVIGMPISGRTLPGTENLIGSFVNIIPLKFEINYQMSLKDFLLQARRIMISAQEHQEYPFHKLLEAIFPGEKLANYGVAGQEPLFRNVFDYKGKTSGLDVSTEAIKLKIFDLDEKYTGNDLFLKLWEEDDQLKFSVLYNCEILAEQTVREFSKQFIKILELNNTSQDLTLQSFFSLLNKHSQLSRLKVAELF